MKNPQGKQEIEDSMNKETDDAAKKNEPPAPGPALGDGFRSGDDIWLYNQLILGLLRPSHDPERFFEQALGDRYPESGTPRLKVQRNSVFPSYLELPVMTTLW